MFVRPTAAAVLIPGTGSDEAFVRAVFAGLLAALGVELIAPPPPRGDNFADGYLAWDGGDRRRAGVADPRRGDLVRRTSRHRVGDALACWPRFRPGTALPGGHPAALSAELSADLVARDGLESALAASIDGVPCWWHTS